MWQGNKWEVFDGESDDIICVVKEEKGNLEVFRNFDLKEMDPNYKTHKQNNLGCCKPWDYVILHGTEPLAEVHIKPWPFKLLISYYGQEVAI